MEQICHGKGVLETEVTNANIVVLRRGVNLVVKTGPTGKLTGAFGIVLNPIQSSANSVSLGE